MLHHPRYLIISVCLLVMLAACTHSSTIKKDRYLHPKVSGAFHALNELSSQRSYPNKNIPEDKFYQEYNYAQQSLQDNRRGGQQSWEALGPWNTSGRTLSMAFNPLNTNTIYAATASGGLWKSHQLGMGKSWQYVKTGFPVTAVSSIAINPVDTNEMYIGTGEVYNYEGVGTGAAFRNTRGSYGIGILKSSDGGRTWEQSLDWTRNQRRGVNVVKIDPENPSTIFAATSEGLYRSLDNGASWIQVLDVIMAMDVAIQSGPSNVLLVTCGNFGSEGAGLYRSDDNGDNWIQIDDPSIPVGFQGKAHVDFSESNPSVVYMSIGNGFWFDDGASWILKSEDAGLTWNLVNTFDYTRWQGWFAHNLAVNPKNDQEAVFVGIEAWVTQNGGGQLAGYTWGGLVTGTPPVDGPDSEDPSYVHADIHDVVYHPTNTDTVILVTDGGLFFSSNGAESFISINGGMQTTQFYNGFSVAKDGSV
ncbi:MAG: hypothetical protein AAGK97_05775 [Bacteroidota bacterium]